MAQPIILESILRIEHTGLAIACLLLAGALVAVAIAWPIARARWIHYGAVNANPILSRDLAKSVGKYLARGQRIKELELELAEIKEKHAALSGAMAHAYHLAEVPTEKQRNLVLLGRTRR